MTANTTKQPLYIPAGTGTGDAIDLGNTGGQRGHVAINARYTGDTFSLLTIEVAPGGGVPVHVHTIEDETFYIVAGRFACVVGDKHFEAGPGDTLFGPRHFAHTWTCISETPGRLVTIVTPGENFETFFCEMNRCINEPDQTRDRVALGAKIAVLAELYQMTIFPPGVTVPNASEAQATFPPLYIPAGEGLFGDLGDHRGWVKVGAHQNETKFLLAEAQVDKNGGVPPHIHHREDEMFHILEGSIVFQVGEQIIEAGPGDTVFAPRDIMHAFQCISDGGARMLVLMTPGDNSQAFTGAMATMNIVPARDMQDPAVVAKFVALAAEYGIEMLPPAIK